MNKELKIRDDIGPLYCERIQNQGLSEPLNFYTNSIIIFLAVFLFIFVYKNYRKSFFGYFSATLLLLTGIGSFLWHGYRTSLFLTLDTVPGVFLLFTIIFITFNNIFGYKKSILSLLLVFSSISILSRILIQSNPILFFISMFAIILSLSIFAVFSLKQKNIPQEYFIYAVGFALFAAIMRSIDIPFCENITFGTHFLWHIFLPLGATLAIIHNLQFTKKL